MRVSLSYITTTTSVSRLTSDTDPSTVGPHTLDPLGFHPGTGALYLLEHFEDETGDLPALYVMHTHGSHVGRMTPVRSWYQGDAAEVEARFEERLAALRADLVELDQTPPSSLQLDTRVVKRRALRLFPGEPPIRKYELRLTVRPSQTGRRPSTLSSLGASTSVTGYLRPRARLVDSYQIPGEQLALAVVEYVGIPFELGHTKEAALLVPLV
jgi:hypothetical protein